MARIVLRGRGNTSYFEPSWSRSGRLAVTRDVYGQGGSGHSEDDVIILRPRRASLVPFGGGFEGSPTWAPDNKRIALMEGRSQVGGSLSVGRIGGKAKPLQACTCNLGDDEAAWSPDGKTIAFVRNGYSASLDEFTDVYHLFLVKPDGGGRKQVTKAAAHNPSWSPDSKQIVFDDEHTIKVIKIDGSGLRTLYSVDADAYAFDPAWSPDGRRIAFVREGKSTGDAIWVMDADGSNAHLLIRRATSPAWKRG